jgi:hypothetical protein
VKVEIVADVAADGRKMHRWTVLDRKSKPVDSGTAWTEAEAVKAAERALDRAARRTR